MKSTQVLDAWEAEGHVDGNELASQLPGSHGKDAWDKVEEEEKQIHALTVKEKGSRETKTECKCGVSVKRPKVALVKEFKEVVAEQAEEGLPHHRIRAKLVARIPRCYSNHSAALLLIEAGADKQNGQAMTVDAVIADVERLREKNPNAGIKCESGCFACGTHARSGNKARLVSAGARAVDAARKDENKSSSAYRLRYIYMAATSGQLDTETYRTEMRKLGIDAGGSGRELPDDQLDEDIKNIRQKIRAEKPSNALKDKLEGLSQEDREQLMREESAKYHARRKARDYNKSRFYQLPDVDKVAEAIASMVGQRGGKKFDLAFKIMVVVFIHHAGMGRVNTLLRPEFLAYLFGVTVDDVMSTLKMLRKAGLIYIAKNGAPGRLPGYRVGQAYIDHELSSVIASKARLLGIDTDPNRAMEYNPRTGSFFAINPRTGEVLDYLGTYGKAKQKWQRVLLAHGSTLGLTDELVEFVEGNAVHPSDVYSHQSEGRNVLTVHIADEKHYVVAPVVEDVAFHGHELRHKRRQSLVAWPDKSKFYGSNKNEAENSEQEVTADTATEDAVEAAHIDADVVDADGQAAEIADVDASTEPVTGKKQVEESASVEDSSAQDVEELGLEAAAWEQAQADRAFRKLLSPLEIGFEEILAEENGGDEATVEAPVGADGSRDEVQMSRYVDSSATALQACADEVALDAAAATDSGDTDVDMDDDDPFDSDITKVKRSSFVRDRSLTPQKKDWIVLH
ncbi:hypothetical protein [Nesterenkonia alba]|uniref:hypothetical protein n=1 Tax=Nesterenkonia alba TaxID=515814 RepID=UPI0004270765|nr:hypothetical protein [Nesterenkonia alba]